MRGPCWSVEEGAHPGHAAPAARLPRLPSVPPCPEAAADRGDRAVPKAGPGKVAHFGSALPGVGHPSGSCPVLFHALYTFLHPLLFSPSPQ